MTGPRARGFVAGVALFALVLSWLPVQTVGAPPDGVERSFRIDMGSAGTKKVLEAFDTGNIAAYDLDGDGKKEIIAHNDNNRLYVFGHDGSLVGELETRHSSGWSTRELAAAAVGDVNGNGKTDIVVTNSAAWLTVFEVSGFRGGMSFEKLWEVHMDPHDFDPDYAQNNPWAADEHPGLDGAPYLADVDGDGRDEIFLQVDDMPGFFSMDGQGGLRWMKDWGDGNANPTATDVTGDGRIESLHVTDGGRLYLFDGDSGQARCSFNTRDEGVRPASISISPTVVDLTGDGRKEAVFGAREAVEDEDDPEWYLKQHAHYFAVTADCQVLWHKTWEWGNPHIYMHPIPVDVTGDGVLDVVFQDWNTIGHKPGSWQATGSPNLFAVEGNTGKLLWHKETNGYWSNSNVALADVTGDGDQELLVVEANHGIDGLGLYTVQGERFGHIPAPDGWVVNGGASVVDLDGDGGLEIVMPIMRSSDHCDRDLDVGCREGAFQVYSTNGDGEPVWPNVKFYNDRLDDTGIRTGAEVTDEPPEGSRVDEDPGSSDGGDQELKKPDDAEEDESEYVSGNESEYVSDNESEYVSDNESETVSGDEPENASGDESGYEPGDEPDSTEAAYHDEGQDESPRQTEEDREGEDDENGAFRPVFELLERPEHPSDPIRVRVDGDGVQDVEMTLDDRPLDVEFSNGVATHSPQEPLPEGDHLLVVKATDSEGASATESWRLSIQEQSSLDPDDGTEEEPRFPEDPGDDDPGEDRPTPMGGLLVVAAFTMALLVVGVRRARRE